MLSKYPFHLSQQLRRFAVSIAVLSLASCGGSSSTSSSTTPVQADQYQLARTQKAAAVSDYQQLVQELYVSYFGRPADPVGLANFEAQLYAANAPTDIQSLNAEYSTNPTIKSLVDSFGTSAESTALYGSGNTTQFVTAIYQNVLGRAPNQAGLTFWTNAINSGTLTVGDASLSIMAGALSNTTTQGLADVSLINNRLTVASDFSSKLTAMNAVQSYTGSKAAAAARVVLSEINANSSSTTFDSIVTSAISALAATNPSPQGFWVGTSSTSTFNILVTPDNQFWGVQTTGSVLTPSFGQVTPSNNNFSASGVINVNTQQENGVAMNGTFIPGEILNGTSLIAGVSASFQAQYVSTYDSAPSLSAIVGQYAIAPSGTAIISNTGTFSFSLPSGCLTTGTLTPDSSGKNFYRVSYTNGMVGCDAPGASGSGVLVAMDAHELFVDVGSTSYVQAFILSK